MRLKDGTCRCEHVAACCNVFYLTEPGARTLIAGGFRCTPLGPHCLLLHLSPPCQPDHAGCCREFCCQQPCRLQKARRPLEPCCRCFACAPGGAWSHPLHHACWQCLPAAAAPWCVDCPSLSTCIGDQDDSLQHRPNSMQSRPARLDLDLDLTSTSVLQLFVTAPQPQAEVHAEVKA